MAKQFAVNGAFRNAPAVDGEIFAHTALAVVVNQAGNDLLTYSTLASDENREVGLCHLKSDIKSMVQTFAVANDAIALFDGL